MSRSLKKGPFVDAKLAKKVAKLTVGDRTVTKTWARASTITPEMVGFTQFITVACMFRCLSQKTWLDINSVSLAQLVSSVSTAERIRSNHG